MAISGLPQALSVTDRLWTSGVPGAWRRLPGFHPVPRFKPMSGYDFDDFVDDAFAYVDENQDGYITIDEFHRFGDFIFEPMTEQQVQEEFQIAECSFGNCDGYLERDELYTYMYYLFLMVPPSAGSSKIRGITAAEL